ncbi:unnamed protein product [Paramecium sonneborni]|uniref:Uncharacterized protein n=1 Tax=Paramecium sonneborni TaxID=65129 RepID=A0A8S1RPZ6_9CILI|nr:unnamed protein product [Paramecium sonneborni]
MDIQLIKGIIFINQFIIIYSIQASRLKVQFITKNQFFWIQEIDKLYVSELKERFFQKNLKTIIQLITNNQKPDEYRFPLFFSY